MNKLDLISSITYSFLLIGVTVSAILKINWLLIISAVLMAVSVFTVVLFSAKSKKSSSK